MPLLLKRASELQQLLGPFPWTAWEGTPPAAGKWRLTFTGTTKAGGLLTSEGRGGSLLRAEGAGQAEPWRTSWPLPQDYGAAAMAGSVQALSPALWQVGRAAASRPMQPGCSCRKGSPAAPPLRVQSDASPTGPGTRECSPLGDSGEAEATECLLLASSFCLRPAAVGAAGGKDVSNVGWVFSDRAGAPWACDPRRIPESGTCSSFSTVTTHLAGSQPP